MSMRGRLISEGFLNMVWVRDDSGADGVLRQGSGISEQYFGKREAILS